MDAKQFLSEFGHIVDAPDGLKRLRELIYQLAVKGELGLSNEEESATDFLEKLLSEKRFHGRNDKKLPQALGMDNFKIPRNWVWENLGALSTDIHYGYTAKAINRKEGIRLLRITDIQNDKVDWSAVPSCDIDEKAFKKNRLSNGDILIARTGGTIGKTYLVENLDRESVFASYLIRFIPLESVYSHFVKLFTLSPLYWDQLYAASAGTGQPNVNATSLKQLQIPIPPFEEQKRIVSKVDELMVLCDKLEAQQQKRYKLQTLTRTTALDALANAQSPHELKDAWQRVQANMSKLFQGPEDVIGLRGLILDTAVKGNLVLQDRNDTDAAELVNEIEKVKKELLKNKLIGKQTKLRCVTDEERPFKLPRGWVFIRLGDITNKIGSGSTPRGGKSAYVKEGIPFLRSQNVWDNGLRMHDVAYIPESTHEKMSNTAVLSKDILLNITGASLGRCALVPDDFGEANVSQHVTIIRSTKQEIRHYLHLCMLSPYTQKMIWGRQVGMAREGLSKKVLEQFEIPLPPIEEQQRIVTKVNSLMLLCDELEKQLIKAESTSRKLAQASVASITGMQIQDEEKMKTPTTELVSTLKLKVSPTNKDQAPLSAILAKHNGELSSKALWNYSGLEIDAFYRQLKTEMARDWIVEPQKARVIEKDAEQVNEAEAG